MRKIEPRRADGGAGKLTLLVFGVLIAAGTFVAYHVMPFYYYYFELEQQMQQLTRVANIYSDKELRDKLATHMKRMEIPASVDEVKIERTGDYVRIGLQYQEVFSVYWKGTTYDLYTFDFNAYAEGQPE